MKKFYLFILLLVCFYFAKATNPVPNYSFENWTSGEPDNWATSNDSRDGFIPITQTTPGYNSTYAAMGQLAAYLFYTRSPVLSCIDSGYGFPIDQNYNNFEFYYKGKMVNGNIFIASVIIENARHDSIGAGIDTIRISDTGFTDINVNIVYLNGDTAASAIITFSMPNLTGDTASYFIVDDVSLNAVAAGIETISAESKLNVYPIPAHDWLTVKGEIKKANPFQLMLTNAIGCVVMERKSETPFGNFINEELNVSGLPSGIYSLILFSDEGMLTRKIILQ